MTIKSTFLGMLTWALSSVYGFAQTPCLYTSNMTTEIRYAIGSQATLTWAYDPTAEYLIDGFYLYRSPSTSKNLGGTLGPFTRVATISKTLREFKLSAPKGTYAYFVTTYKGTFTSTPSNQVRITWADAGAALEYGFD